MTTKGKIRYSTGGHVVRITVLGLAGVTVNRKKCRDSTKKKFHPAPPSEQKVVVAFFSGNSKIKGITTLSKNLTISPSDFEQQRHVAVWTSSDATAMGSVVTFEANLTPEEVEARPFALTVAMAEDDEHDHKVALPFGVATLPIRGDECKNGQSVTLDLHVSSLTADEEKHPMLAIQKKTKDLPRKRRALQRLFSNQQKMKIPSEGQRRAFEKTYSMDGGEGILRISLEVYEKGSHVEKTFVSRRLRGEVNEFKLLLPSSSPKIKKEECNEVAVKSAEASDDNEEEHVAAAIDESLAVIDKYLNRAANSMLSRDKVRYALFQDSSRDDASNSMDDATYASIFSRSRSLETSTSATTTSCCPSESATSSLATSVDTSVATNDEDDVSKGTASVVEEQASVAKSIAANEENVAFQWENSLNSLETDDEAEDDDDDDDYTLSFEKKPSDRSIVDSEATPVKDSTLSYEIDLFGRSVTIPSCNITLPKKITRDVIVARDAIIAYPMVNSLRGKFKSIRQDVSAATSGFVNSYFQNIQCATNSTDDDDDNSTGATSNSESNTPVRDHDSFGWTKKILLCQAEPLAEPVIIPDMDSLHVGPLVRHTFSTISAEPQ